MKIWKNLTLRTYTADMIQEIKIKCPNPACGEEVTLRCDPQQAVGRRYRCKRCDEVFLIKDPQETPEETVKDRECHDAGAQPTVKLFAHDIVLIREDDGYPYLFFKGRTTIGRYDTVIKSDILIRTEDRHLSTLHAAVIINRGSQGAAVSLECLNVDGFCKVDGKLLEYNDRIELADGCNIRLGDTNFKIMDIRKEEL